MSKKNNEGVYLKEEVDFEPTLKKNNNNKSKIKGDCNGKIKKKHNGKNIPQ